MHEFDRCYFEDGIWLIDPNDEPEIDEDGEDDDWLTPFTEWMEEDFNFRETCPYCGTRLDTHAFDSEHEQLRLTKRDRNNVWSGVPDLAFLKCCNHCAYWQWCDYFENRGTYGSAAMSVLGKFNPKVPQGCLSELSQHLRRKPALWHKLDPKGMERLVAEIFRANYKDAEVIHVGKPGDRGIDVVFVEANGTKWLIQVKRHEHERSVEGFETLQKLLGTLTITGELRGVIASNASHFSYQARREAEGVSARGYTIELLDRGKLDRMLGAALPDRPWRHYLTELKLPDVLLKKFLNKPNEPSEPSEPRPRASRRSSRRQLKLL